jgi:hypothetical protein
MIGRFLKDVGDLFDGFTADLFWDFVTSAPVLLMVAAVALAAVAVAHVPRVVQWLPSVKAYVRAASILQVVAVILLGFLLGFRLADDRAETTRLKDELTFKQFQLDNAAATAADAARLKNEAEAQALAAKGKLDEYCSKFGCGDDRKVAPATGVRVVRKCDPPPGYVDWLRNLQRRRPAAGRT